MDQVGDVMDSRSLIVKIFDEENNLYSEGVYSSGELFGAGSITWQLVVWKVKSNTKIVIINCFMMLAFKFYYKFNPQ